MKLSLNNRYPIKLFHRIKNLVSQFTDPNFNTFIKMEFKVDRTDSLNDLRKLRYVRNLELAESGFINTGLKEQLTLLLRRDRLFQKDQDIIPVGRISIHEDENKLMRLLLGYHKMENRVYISYYHVNNCPVWHRYTIPLLKESVQRPYPSKSDYLFMKHRYFQRDIEQLDSGVKTKLLRLFNGTLQNTYSHNRHLQKGIQPIVPPIGNPPKLSKELPLQIKKGTEGLFVPVTIGKNAVVLAPYLKVANDINRLYLSTEEFRSLLVEKSITLLAETKYGVSLGIHKDDLYLKATERGAISDILKQWMALDDFLGSKSVPKILKYNIVNKVIEKKDFFVKLDEIPLRGTKDILLLKKHYGSGKTYFVVAENGKKPKPVEYRPITRLKLERPERYESYKEYLNTTKPIEPLGRKEKTGIKISI